MGDPKAPSASPVSQGYPGTRLRGRAVLTLLAGVLLFVVLVSQPMPMPGRTSDVGSSDAATFVSMLTRLREGATYYQAYGEELRRRQYPAGSVFNWRTPLLLSGLARIPDRAGRGVLGGFGVLLLAATISVTARQSPWLASSVVMQLGALLWLLWPGGVVMSEIWAGVLIGLSVCMYARERATWAVLLGLLALFVRELAAPYCVACAVAAVVNRRSREAISWVAGASLYTLYYGWHVAQVWAHQVPTDLGLPVWWLEPPGLQSLLTKAPWNAWLLVSPAWVVALALTIVVLGVFAPKAPLHMRLASAVYVAFFLVAGQIFNGYWGLVAWPTWAISFGYGLDMTRNAAATAFRFHDAA